jgi:hypothetical protein
MSRRSSALPEVVARGGPPSSPAPAAPRPWLARAKDAVTSGDEPLLQSLLAPKFAEQATEAVRPSGTAQSAVPANP